MKKLILTSVVALSVFVGAQSVSAFTAAEVETLITLLGGSLSSTQVASLRALATPATPAVSYTRQMGVGATGADVSALQSMLISKGYLVIAGPTGYFGPATQAAVVKYQVANGVTPASGYVGPMTLAKLNASVVVVPPVVPPVTPVDNELSGTDGTISDVNKLSQYNNEEVGDGESDVKIVGFEVEASNDGDISLRSVKLTFDGSANTGSKKLADYLDVVKVWQGTEELGSVDASDFNKDSSGVYSKTITLDSSIIRADEKEKFYITVDAVSNLDSSDIAASADAWTVDLDSIRYEDGSGVVTTDTDAGDLGGSLDNVTMSFVSFSTAANTELKISTDSSSPEADTVMVDDTDNTDDVVLLVGKMKLEGTSDAVLDELPITLTATGATDIDFITGNLKLVIDGEEYSESVTTAGVTSATVTFNNLDLTLDSESTVTFKVMADINDLSTDFEAGDTLKASLTSTNRDYIVIENEEGDELSDSTEKSGTATGEAQEFRTSGIMLTFISNTPSPTADNAVANNDLGTFVLKFKVTAIGETVYVSSLADAQLTGVTTGYTTVNADRAGTATVGGTSVSLRNVTDTTKNATGLYEIEEGSANAETFELTTTLQLPAAGTSGVYHVTLGGVSWTTDSTDATPNNAYTSNLDEFVVTGTLN